MDTTGIDADDPDTIVISGRRYAIPHTPERAAIAVTMKTHGIAFDLASPYDTDYRRPLDTLDDRL
ncbi:hypothetical protein [Mycobacteroides abscessus]|uniref:hypothetical protein n=1 Tax=Mycobacteroides abscessus TaxID=36809 RepID=UPI00025882A9|nr:hypothetical protein [Mycobacteroides abscessus]EIC62266.1 hypothetical protein S7W_24076 [Mycobacteroides abscessus M94]SKZ51088.1 Uncharacterised protein [Mycobacteroides abscessus subsp. abscessus]